MFVTMLTRAEALSVRKVTLMILMVLGMGVDTAPTERDVLLSRTHASTVPAKSPALNLSQYLKEWLVSTRAASVDGMTTKTTTRTFTAGTRSGRPRINYETSSVDKQAQMLKMISALEELHRTFNSTLSSRITIMPRANGRGRKNKGAKSPANVGTLRTTTAPPAAADSTVSGASADANAPNLPGRTQRKSLQPQNRKTNKRVCFWKYCSQN